MSKATKLFRPDIQVMRGIAVLSVVLFHFRENIFSTGYLGVDVFFVISGFVVTPLLVRIFENQNSKRNIVQNLLEFYRRRFYRLAPAMGATLVLSAILIYLLGNVNDLERFSKQGLATLLLIGNFGAYEYSGEYFSPNPNPLVHMWSLSLEEQIYIGMPLILFFALKRIKVGEEARRVSNVFLFLLITSSLFFAFPQLLEPLWTSLDVSNSSAMNFYSPFTRVWQFSLGGLIYLFPRKSIGGKFSTISQMFLAASLLFLFIPRLSIDFRVGSLVASTIAALALMSQSLAILPKGISGLLEWFGNRSYSIYLVHMPLIYLAKYSPVQFLESNRRISSIAAVILTIILGNAVYNKFEQKYRLNQDHPRTKDSPIIKLIVAFMLVPGILLSLISTTSNLTTDTHQVSLRGCVDAGFDPVRCMWEAQNSKGLIMLVGDSQVYGNADGVIAAANGLGYDVIASSVNGCPFLDIQSSGEGLIDCGSWQNQVMDFILEAKPQVVMIANRTNGYNNPNSGWRTFLNPSGAPISSRESAITAYEDSLERVMAKITSSQIPVVLFQNIPEPKGAGAHSVLTNWMNRDETVEAPLESMSVDYEVAARENLIVQKYSSTKILNPIPQLCPNNTCLLIENGTELYRDNWHLSEYGSLRLSGLIRAVLQEIAKA